MFPLYQQLVLLLFLNSSAWLSTPDVLRHAASEPTFNADRRRERREHLSSIAPNGRIAKSSIVKSPNRREISFPVTLVEEESAMNWLFKEEPSHYAFETLVADGATRWSGVKNPQAQKNLRSVRKGDAILYYHTGDEKAVVGLARAKGNAYPDPEMEASQGTGPHVVDVEPVRRLSRPVTLAAMKANAAFAESPLVRIPRLSVMPITDKEWAAVEKMAGEKLATE
jgi:predicted RNA-binding protein with PUA-like domain